MIRDVLTKKLLLSISICFWKPTSNVCNGLLHFLSVHPLLRTQGCKFSYPRNFQVIFCQKPWKNVVCRRGCLEFQLCLINDPWKFIFFPHDSGIPLSISWSPLELPVPVSLFYPLSRNFHVNLIILTPTHWNSRVISTPTHWNSKLVWPPPTGIPGWFDNHPLEFQG
jgi:hypothetical protein